jgi:Family of unknown function (DUF6209)
MRPFLFSLLLVAGCGAGTSTPIGETSSSSLEASAKIAFRGDWSVASPSPLLSGRKVELDYADARNTMCGGNFGGKPAWSTTGYARVNGGPVQSFWAAGLSPTGNTDPPVLDLEPQVGDADLEMWFETTNRWGCVMWDSNFGRNFHFRLASPPEAPGWFGNPTSLLERGSCGGKPCESDRHPLGSGGATFDTWVRTRAVYTEIAFEVYEQGTTDWNDPDTWKKLDTQAHARFAPADFASQYVDIEDRVGNNVRYGFNLRTLDPFRGPAPQTKDDCPKVPIHLVNGMLEARADLYLTVNGAALRPAPGATWPITYLENPGPYSICVTP